MVTLATTFESQDTWYATWHLEPLKSNPAIRERIIDFISFSNDWHERIASADPHEFSQFSDVVAEKAWQVELSDGTRLSIDKAPVFYGSDEVSWKVVAT